jgi:hypothetical protein
MPVCGRGGVLPVVWPVPRTLQVARIAGAHSRHVYAAVEVGDRFVCTSGDDDRLRIWDSKNGWVLHNQIVGRSDSFLCLLSVQVRAERAVCGRLRVCD